MKYKLFKELITLQALLKELSIIPSGGAIKVFLQDYQVTVNGELEQRRGRKLRVNDVVNIPELSIEIHLVQPSEEEINEFQKDQEEKERLTQLVKEYNKKNKKKPSSNQKKKVRFPGIF